MAVDADRLRCRRDELGLRNSEVAELADIEISPRYVENIMQGRDQPARRVIFSLARVLKVPAEEIDPDIRAGKRTPRGVPSEPPNQPKNEPTHPPKRQDKEGDRKAPRRIADGAAA